MNVFLRTVIGNADSRICICPDRVVAGVDQKIVEIDGRIGHVQTFVLHSGVVWVDAGVLDRGQRDVLQVEGGDLDDEVLDPLLALLGLARRGGEEKSYQQVGYYRFKHLYYYKPK